MSAKQLSIHETIHLLRNIEQKIAQVEENPYVILDNFFAGISREETTLITNLLRQVNLNGYHIDELFNKTLERIPEFKNFDIRRYDSGHFALGVKFDLHYSTVLDVNVYNKKYDCKMDSVIEEWKSYLSRFDGNEPVMPETYKYLEAAVENPSLKTKYQLARYSFVNEKRILPLRLIVAARYFFSREIAIEKKNAYLQSYNEAQQRNQDNLKKRELLEKQLQEAEQSLRLQVSQVLDMLHRHGYSAQNKN